MKKMDNSIVLARSIQENFLWSDKPFSMGQAWIDLLMLAEWCDKDVVSRGEIVHLKRGQVGRSILWLADRWGWDRKRVKRFLVILESQKMATTDSTTKGTIITIENYNKYQFLRTTDDSTDDSNVGQRPDTTKEIKEVKEINNNIPSVYSPTQVQKVIDIYNEECTSLPRVRSVSEARKKKIKARLKERTMDELTLAFKKVEQSDFLSGRNGRWTSCNFDWLMQNETNLLKILEGVYDNKDSIKSSAMRDLKEIGITQGEYEEMQRRFE